MWDYDISKARQREETAQLQERAAQEKIVDARLASKYQNSANLQERLAADRTLKNTDFAALIERESAHKAQENALVDQKFIAQKEFSSSLGETLDNAKRLESSLVEKSFRQGLAQEKWLEKNVQRSRDQEDFFSTRREAFTTSLQGQNRSAAVRTDAKPEPFGKQNTAATTSASEAGGNKKAALCAPKTAIPVKKPEAEAEEAQFISRLGKEGITFEGGKTTGDGSASTSGTQSASKEPNIMTAFFAMHSDAKNENPRSWQRRAFEDGSEEFEVAGGAARLRQGALTENTSSNEYRRVLLEQTMMPRLAELVQKLSAMGYSWARVVIPVDAKTKVVVRFNTKDGRVKIHLCVPEDDFCQVIREGWESLKKHLFQQGITLDDPTFETNSSNSYEQ